MTAEPAALEWRHGHACIGDVSLSAVVASGVGSRPDHGVHILAWASTVEEGRARAERIYRAGVGPRLSHAEQLALRAALEMAGRWSDDPEHDTTKLNEIAATLAPLLEPVPR